MSKEVDIEHTVVAKINGYQIVRSVAINTDKITGREFGHKKVYYDVCDEDDLLVSFKTLTEAKRFANNS